MIKHVVALVLFALSPACSCSQPCKTTTSLFEVQGDLGDSVGGVGVKEVVTDGNEVDIVLNFADPVTIRFTKLGAAPVLPDTDASLAVDVASVKKGTATPTYVRISDGNGPFVEGGSANLIDGKGVGASEIDGALVSDKSQATQACESENASVASVDATFASDEGSIRVPIGESKRISVDGTPMLAIGLGGEAGSSVDPNNTAFHTFRVVNGYAYRVAP